MKYTNLMFILMLFGLSCKAQRLPSPDIVFPLEDYSSYIETHDKIPGGTYFKDVNHLLDKYVGTWTGNYKNHTYTLEIVEKIAVPGSARHSLKYDQLRIRYKITDSAGNLIRSTLNLPDDDVLIIDGLVFKSSSAQTYKAVYVSEQSTCGDWGTLYLSIANPNETQMSLYIAPGDTMTYPEECPDGYTSPPFPKKNETPMVLTKQD